MDGIGVRITANLSSVAANQQVGATGAAVLPGMPEGLVVRSRTSLFGVGAPAVPTGGPMLDGAVDIDGHPADVAAVFDAQTRRLVHSWSPNWGFELSNQRLKIVLTDVTADDAINRLLNALTQLGTSFQLDPAERAARLARNATEDPVADVRLNCLRALVDYHPDAPEQERALESALVDPSAEVRLYAADRLGDESAGEHARAVARLLAGSGEPGERAAALGRLAESGTLDDVAWLRPLTRGLFRGGAVKAAAQQAIDGILERFGAEQGALAVVPEALADDAQGRLSALPDLDGALAEAEEGPRPPRKQSS